MEFLAAISPYPCNSSVHRQCCIFHDILGFKVDHTSFISHSADRTILSLIARGRKSESVTYSTPVSSNRISNVKRPKLHASCLKTPDSLHDYDDASLEKNYYGSLTFPNVFQSFVEEVCEETDIAEVKLKIGEFEVHVKRNIDKTKGKGPAGTSLPVEAKPVSGVPPNAVVVPPSVTPKATGKVNPFTNTSFGKSVKLEALEASGISGFVTIASTMVGSFKGMRNNEKTPIVSEGDIIRKGGIVGYVLQSGRAIPLKSDVTGEVLELLVQDGDAIAYGDPIVAVLPSLQC